jgi:hypothetical protein
MEDEELLYWNLDLEERLKAVSILIGVEAR